jgi:hypothetical protein
MQAASSAPSERNATKWWRGWPPLIVIPAAVLLFAPDHWSRWLVMWLLAFTIYCGCKWLTWRRTALQDSYGWRDAAYLLAWPGLDATAFLFDDVTDPPHAGEWIRGVRNVLAGAVLFFGIARFSAPYDAHIAGWIGMTGIVLMLHFGTFDLISCMWRVLGLEARPLMNKPIVSESLGEFWGRRWNTAFRDLTHRFLFRPMTRRFGTIGGIAGGFVFSGLVHELVISVPSGGGYGGPTVFFTLQGVGILFERSKLGKAIGLARGARGWLFTMLVLVAPAAFLFHPPFVERIVVPFMRALGAL